MAKRKDPLLRSLGWRVRQLREKKRWTQETLAERAALDRSYIAGIEAGLRNPSIKALGKIARIRHKPRGSPRHRELKVRGQATKSNASRRYALKGSHHGD